MSDLIPINLDLFTGLEGKKAAENQGVLLGLDLSGDHRVIDDIGRANDGNFLFGLSR